MSIEEKWHQLIDHILASPELVDPTTPEEEAHFQSNIAALKKNIPISSSIHRPEPTGPGPYDLLPFTPPRPGRFVRAQIANNDPRKDTCICVLNDMLEVEDAKDPQPPSYNELEDKIKRLESELGEEKRKRLAEVRKPVPTSTKTSEEIHAQVIESAMKALRKPMLTLEDKPRLLNEIKHRNIKKIATAMTNTIRKEQILADNQPPASLEGPVQQEVNPPQDFDESVLKNGKPHPDIFVKITLTFDRNVIILNNDNDVAYQSLVNKLIVNFKQYYNVLHVKLVNALYTIENHRDGIPHLHGLLHYYGRNIDGPKAGAVVELKINNYMISNNHPTAYVGEWVVEGGREINGRGNIPSSAPQGPLSAARYLNLDYANVKHGFVHRSQTKDRAEIIAWIIYITKHSTRIDADGIIRQVVPPVYIEEIKANHQFSTLKELITEMLIEHREPWDIQQQQFHNNVVFELPE